MRKILLLAGALICTSLNTKAQLVSGNAFLQGQYIEVGINQCGSWGTTSDAPTGYHARSGIAGISTTSGNSLQNLGFVADPDKDGWTIGSPNKYNGDYFMPSQPYCGWGISFGSFDYGNGRENSNKNNCGSLSGTGTTAFPGTMQSVTNSNGIMQALWQGTANGMQVQKIVSVKSSKLYFTVQIKLKNTSASAISNVYYGDYVNPDNDYYYQDVTSGGTLSTKDTIVFQNPTDGKTLVKGIGSITQSYIALGSKDCRAKVGRANGYPEGSVAGWYNGTTASYVTLSGSSGSTNNAICISFSLGTLAAGDSTSFSYTYILKENDFDEALATTDPGFTSNGVSYQSGDTILNCAASPLNLSITNGEYYNWTWSPATGLNTTTGLNVTANPTSTTRYIATGTGICATKYDTITVFPISRLYVDNSVAVSGNGNSWASPMKTVSQALNFANTTCVNEIWVKSGTYYPMSGITTVATSRDSSFRILRNGIKLYGGFAGTETTLAQRNIAANVTTLSGDIGVANDSTDNAHHVVTILAPAGDTLDTSTILSGFTIRGGNANINTGSTYNGLPVIRNDGGGILCAANSNGSAANALVDSCNIVFNYANVGGGMYSGGYTGGTSSPTVRNCLFMQNSASDVAGLHSFSADAGALSSATVINCRFIGNRAVAGGAMGTLNRNGSVTSPTVLNCVFSGNTASSEGGAVNIYSGTFTATNCVFAGNTSPSGSVIKVPSGSTVNFRNSTLYNSSGSTSAAVVSIGTINLNNTILWGMNTTEIANTGTTNANYSDIRGVAATGTNISADPQFVNPANPIGTDNIWGTTDDGLRLTPCSPAINTGSNALVPAGITTDFTSAVRIQNTTVEMGAYEMPYNATGLPATTIAQSPTGPVCSNTVITFTATTTSPGTLPIYQWYKNGVAVAGATQNTYTNNSWGANDSVWVMHTNNDCNLTDTSNKLFIQLTPSLGTTAAPTGPAAVCGSSTGNVYSVTPVSNATTYTWTVPTGWTITSGQGTLSITATAAATNGGSITVTAGNACQTSAIAATTTVTVNPLPAITAATPTGPSTCNGADGSITLSGNFSNSTTYTVNYSQAGTAQAPASVTSSATGIVTITGLNAGSYSAFTVSQLGCTSAAFAGPVVLNSPAIPATPTASSNSPVCAGNALNLSATPVPNATYSWTGPNGFTSTTQNPTLPNIQTTGAGTYSVTATVAACTSLPATTTVVVNATPVVPATLTGNITICNGTTNTYTAATVTGATSYTWTLPNGWTGTSTTASITTVAGATSGNITVTAGTTCGNSAPATLAVTVTSIPTQPAAITGPLAPCANTSQTYTVPALANATSYTWTLPNGWTGTSNTNSITTLASANAGNISVTASNTCGTSAPQALALAPVSIPVTPTPITGNPAPCVGSLQTYTVAALTNATSYSWSAPSGWTPTSNTTSNTVSYITNATGGLLQVQASNGCGSSPLATLSITPTPVLTPSVTITPSATTACQGTNVTFTANPTNEGTNPAYQWKKNGLNVGTSANTYNDANLVSTDVITVVMTSSLPCVTTASVTSSNTVAIAITPTAVPGININTTPGLILCANTSITFLTNITGGGNNPLYQWYLNGTALPGATSATYTGAGFNNGDVLSVMLTSNAQCRSTDTVTSNKVNLTVQPIVVPTLTVTTTPGTNVPAGTTVTFSATVNAPGATPNYQWFRNGVAIAFATASTYATDVIDNGDVFTVRVYGLGLCATQSMLLSDPVRISVQSLGVNTAVSATGSTVLYLYPNPNSGRFTVSTDWGAGRAVEPVQLELVNALGQLVYSREVMITTGKWSVEVELEAGVANGLYMLRLKRQSDGTSLVTKVLLQR